MLIYLVIMNRNPLNSTYPRSKFKYFSLGNSVNILAKFLRFRKRTGFQTGKTIELKVNWSDKIYEIKQKIEDLESISSNRQHLFYADKELEERRCYKVYDSTDN